MGTRVRLQTKPVDPNDFFRGDYVILSYDISDACNLPDRVIDAKDQNGQNIIAPQYMDDSDMTTWEKTMGGKLVYIPLQLSGDTMIASWCLNIKPEQWLYIRGLRQRRGSILFGIEKYFVQQWSGKELENAVWTMQIQASISKWWQARIVGYKFK